MKARNANQKPTSTHNLNATHFNAATIGALFGLFSGMNHGFFEILQGNQPVSGTLIQAIGPDQRFWSNGTEEAFTLLPTYLSTGIASMLVGLVIVVWSLRYLPSRHGRTVFLALFILSFLVGGGIGQVAFFIPAWAFATRMGKPLSWWRSVLPGKTWPLLSMLWPVLLGLATLAFLVGLEIAIFGIFPGINAPETLQNLAMVLVFSAALGYVLAFIAGFGHDLQRIETAS
jgi:hypothetical protein